MKRGNWFIITGGIILLIMLVSYFIPINTIEEYNYAVKVEVTTPLLGLLIFHNSLILALYIAISVALILAGVFLNSKKK